MATLPTLYKKTETGAIQMWEVKYGNAEQNHGVVRTTFGQVDSEKLQQTTDVIKEGKNLGKKNATTAIEQAKVQAKQMWDKKIKSGYVEDIAKASKGESHLEAIKPMLAQVFED